MSTLGLLDLVGRRMDCRSAVSTVLGRMGLRVAPDAFEGRPDLWQRVDAPQPGDVILSRPGGRLHVSVVVSARGRTGAVLSSDALGGVYLASLSRALPDSIGVYRYAGGQP